MSGRTKRKRGENGTSELTGDASLEQIREILFGAQSRDTETQLAELQKALNETVRAVQEQLGRQIKDSDTRFKQEVAALKERIRIERNERAAALKELTGHLNESAAALSQSIAELDERLEGTDDDLRKHFLSELNAATDQWKSRQEELSAYVDEEFEDLRTSTADRTELSDLFRELGQRVAGELKKPAPKG